MAAATAIGEAYLGPSPGSVLTTKTAQIIAAEISGLLSMEAIHDPLRWGPIWPVLEAGGAQMEAVKFPQLIVEQVLELVGTAGCRHVQEYR